MWLSCVGKRSKLKYRANGRPNCKWKSLYTVAHYIHGECPAWKPSYLYATVQYGDSCRLQICMIYFRQYGGGCGQFHKQWCQLCLYCVIPSDFGLKPTSFQCRYILMPLADWLAAGNVFKELKHCSITTGCWYISGAHFSGYFNM